MEQILSIKDGFFKKNPNDYSRFDGFIVTTDKQEIKMGIQDGQSCCESYGSFMTEDKLEDFIGANLLEINITDGLLNSEKFEGQYSGNTMFVTLKTSNGVLQFVAYNDHNGYYGHEAIIISNQLNESEYL